MHNVYTQSIVNTDENLMVILDSENFPQSGFKGFCRLRKMQSMHKHVASDV